ncbi:MAG TPA: helix-hairpin-helix domain-containing protein [Candidatus Baltobacteraceae bacterium]|jgi:competence protein ComEA|nr:helix-hairpin-helix domain-containing protein [Candidatus Baltobacteraceae bacterium]
MIQRIALVAAGAVVVAIALRHPAPQPAFTTVSSSSSPRALPAGQRFAQRRAAATGPSVVYVAGAVAKPGLYRLTSESRAADAVAAAGGMRPSADAAGVNLAARVRDGDEVFVPAIGEAPRSGARVRARSSGRRRTPEPPVLALDVNAAAEDQLAAVPGIGRALAARIVAMREADGAFSTLDALLDVSGMTQSRLERARPYLSAR